jgi:xylose isomerase
MYDFDCAHAFAFLQKYGLEKEYKFNIETNHATLAGHTLSHEVAYALANDVFGSIDANEGDLLLGWDTDQFPIHEVQYTHALFLILQHGGFKSGGFNIDAKVRRQSIDTQDLFSGHMNSVDTLAKALLAAERLLENKQMKDFIKKRYQGWQTPFGKKILKGQMSFEALAKYVQKNKIDPKPKSGRQEMLEGLLHELR